MQIRIAPPGRLGEELPRLISEVTKAEGAPPFSEVLLTALRDPSRGGIGVAGEENGRLAAYAFAFPNPDRWVWTLEAAHSASAQPGDYDRFLEQALQALAGEGVEEVVLWVHAPGLHPGLAGLRPDRRLLRMTVDLPLSGSSLFSEGPLFPEGFEVRGFAPGEDNEALLAVNNRAFTGHPEQGAWTLRDLEMRLGMDWFDAEGLRTAWAGEALAAFNWTKLHPPGAVRPGQAVGEVYALAVEPAFRGQGLGRAVTLDGLRYLNRSRGAESAMLYVDSDNGPAVGLYGGLGFAVEHTDRAYRWTAPDETDR